MFINFFCEYLRFCLAVVAFSFVISCQGETISYLDVEKLPAIEVTLVNEVGVDEELLFGRLRDLILLSGGNFFVSDWEKVSIEQFDSEGNYLGKIANEGRGPGELPSFFLLFSGGKDTLVVRHRGMSQQIDQFAPSTNKDVFVHVESIVMEEINDYYITFLGKRSKSEFYALASRESRDIRSQNFIYPDDTKSFVVIVDKFENILQDSLHLMTSPNPIAKFNQGSMFVIGMPPFQSHSRFRIINGKKYLIAYPDSSAIYVYNGVQNLETVINLNIKPRPIENIDIENFLKNIPKEYHTDFTDRIPDFKPVFQNVWASENYIVILYEKKIDNMDLIVFDLKGEPKGRFSLSRFDAIKAFDNNMIYAIHRDPEKGESIRLYKLDI